MIFIRILQNNLVGKEMLSVKFVSHSPYMTLMRTGNHHGTCIHQFAQHHCNFNYHDFLCMHLIIRKGIRFYFLGASRDPGFHDWFSFLHF